MIWNLWGGNAPSWPPRVARNLCAFLRLTEPTVRTLLWLNWVYPGTLIGCRRERKQKAMPEIDIQTLALLRGYLPPQAMAMTVEWAIRHQTELLDRWGCARQQHPLQFIQPLP